jgi:hypothetical protein
MSLKKVRARILNIEYDKEHNLFQLSLRDLDRIKHTNIAIKGTDWGVTPDVPDEIIDNFCKEMMGKDKNLFIEEEDSDIPKNITKTESIIPPEDLYKMHDNIDQYPIKELDHKLRKEKDSES